MKEKLLCSYLKGKMAVKNFFEQEKGASEMVVILVLIVIVIAVAATFQTKLGEAIGKAFDKLITFIG